MARGTRQVTASSGNVFTDLGSPAAEEKKTKVQLAVALNRIIQKRRLPQQSVAQTLKVNQPKVSALTNYRLDGFSVERLLNFLNALGHDVDIVIRKPRTRRTPGIHVVAA